MGLRQFTLALAVIVPVSSVSLAGVSEARKADISDERLQAGRPILRPVSDVPQGRVQRLVFSDEGGRLRLYAAGDDKLVRKWSISPSPSGNIIFQPEQPIRWPILPGQTGIIFGLDVHPNLNGRTLLAFGGIGIHPSQVELVDVANTSIRQTLKLPEFGGIHQYAYDVAFHPTQPYLVAGLGGYREEGSGATLLVWGWREGTLSHVASVDAGLGCVDFLEFNPAGDRLLAADFGGVVSSWDFSPDAATRLVRLSETNLETRITGVRWTGHRDWVAATESKGLLWNTDSETDSEAKRWTTTRITNNSDAAVTYRVRNATAPKPEWESLPTRRLQPGESFRSNGRTVSVDFNLVETNAAYSQLAPGREFEIWTIDGDPRLIDVSAAAAVAVSAPAQKVAVAIANYVLPSYGDKPYQILLRSTDGSGRRLTLEQPGFEGGVSAIAFSPDGKYLAAAGVDAVALSGSSSAALSGIVLRLWSTSDGRLLGQFPSARAAVKTGGAIANVSISGDDTIAFARGPFASNLIAPNYYEYLQKRGEPLSSSPALTHRLTLNTSELVQSTASPADNQIWLFRQDDQSFSLEQVQGGRTKLGPLPNLASMGTPLTAVGFQVNRREYVAIGYVSGILVWDVQAVREGKARREESLNEAIARGFYGPEGRVTCLAVSAGATDDRWLLAGSEDGTLSAWSLRGLHADPRQRRELQIRLKTEGGRLLVDDVESTGPGWLAGFEPGDEIVGVEWPHQADSGRGSVLPADQWRRALELPIPGFQTVVRIRNRADDGGDSGDVQIIGTRALHQPLWTLYPLVDGNWVLWSPSGYFLTSGENVAQHLGWHKNLGLETFDFFPAEVFRDSFTMRANRRRRLLEYQDPIPPPNEVVYPSSVSITRLDYASGGPVAADRNVLDAPRDLVVSIEAEQRGREQIIGLQLWCNGYFVADAQRPATGTYENTGTAASLRDVVIEKEWLRQESNNTLVAVVESHDPESRATIRNRSFRSVFVRGRSTPKLHYLGIGVTQLDDAAGFRAQGTHPLQFAANDAYYLGKALERACGERYARGTFQILANPSQLAGTESAEVAAPTREAILQALDALVNAAGPDDLVCLLISTHGFNNRLGVPGLYLVAQDTAVDLENAVTREDLYSRLRKLPCAALLLIDACHSGKIESNRHMQEAGELAIGPTVLASSSPGQLSWEQPRLRSVPELGREIGHGVFTAAALEALTGRRLRVPGEAGSSVVRAEVDQSGDGRLSLEELGAYISQRVPRLTAALGLETQSPVLFTSSTQRDRDIDLRDLRDFAGGDQ